MNGEPTSGWLAAAREADVTLELPNGGGPMFFRRLPAGEFRMGSRGDDADAEPAHLVRIGQPFYMGTFPVTQQQWDAWIAVAGKRHAHRHSGSALLPAEQMDWSAARDFCAWLHDAAGIPAGYLPSLPTEVEWEYACRAGTATEYCGGDGDAALAAVGWFDKNSGRRTHPVGELSPNEWGLYDMHGNVWEWCVDLSEQTGYRKRIDGVVQDPVAARAPSILEDSRSSRVVRGGSWILSAWWCRSARRDGGRPDVRFGYLGFRVCLFPGPGGRQASSGEAKRADARADASNLDPLRLPPRPDAVRPPEDDRP